MTALDVTVVIPTRDRWPVVARAALAAALAQEDVELEVVVVDDGSSQPAPPELARRDRVRVVRLSAPSGVAHARNAGFREARGEWVSFLDDDDLWSPRKLRKQLDAAAADTGFVYAGAVWVDEGLRLLQGHEPPRPETLNRELLEWNVLWGGASNVIARTGLVAALGGFDETLFQLADWDLWLRLALKASAAVVDEPLVALVVHAESMLLVDRRDVFVELERLASKHQDGASRAGVQVDRARFARWVAGGHLRAGRRRDAARAYLRGNRAPANVVRAAASFLGPSAFARASRIRDAVPGALGPGERISCRPDWLDLYA